MIYIGNGIYSESGSDILAHYGVPGMKWGVRKARPVSTGFRGARVPRMPKGAKQQMSEAEIKARRRRRIAIGAGAAAAAAAAGYGAYRLINARRARQGLPALGSGNRITEGAKRLPGAALRTAPALYSKAQTVNNYRNMYNQARQTGSIQTKGLALPARSSASTSKGTSSQHNPKNVWGGVADNMISEGLKNLGERNLYKSTGGRAGQRHDDLWDNKYNYKRRY